MYEKSKVVIYNSFSSLFSLCSCFFFSIAYLLLFLQDVEDVRPYLSAKYRLHELLAAAVPPPGVDG